MECPIHRDHNQKRDATWRIVGRPITREIRAVDLHLSEGGVRGEIGFTGWDITATVDRKVL